ncbi:MAG: polymer-forming cytoskeletal protein [Candidatus Lambdaproteobacteria bacterium]|nr:polymer-forming cytoskeletal protein [Candidatus Lambdaproteobacteria bacterium]
MASKNESGNGGASGEVSLLGTDSRFQGVVRFSGTLRVDGEIKGDITSPAGSGSVLIVNAQAVVEGDIVSDSVLISGRVVGNIQARDRVEIFRTGYLRGDMHTGDIMIEGGAEFQGQCHMLRDGGRGEPAAAAAQTPGDAPPGAGVESAAGTTTT